jgi:wyosine [tRNA(Phe)-imidazoG37] synthetase (radical SAM superfamily)
VDVTGGRLPVLTFDRHDRDVVGLTYVYPVVSRRAKGVSIGINLNPNNACNWRCVYCQVPGLIRGSAPPIDLPRLERELERMLGAVTEGDFLERHVNPELRELCDVALSGNGEPTSSAQFKEVLEVVARALRRAGTRVPIVVITNGSLIDRAAVQDAMRYLATLDGRVWFKLDAGSDAGMEAVNSAHTGLARHVERLRLVSGICSTWVQSCWFVRRDREPAPEEVDLYVEELAALVKSGATLRGVYLYTLARTSSQPEAAELRPVSREWLERLGERLRLLGLCVNVASLGD